MDTPPKFTRLKGAVANVTGMLRLKRLGKIRLGVKQQSKSTGREYPTETDYFVCPPEIQAVYGEKPTMLEGLFLSNDLEQIYQEKLALYGKSSGLHCHGNGEVAMRRDDQGNWTERPCPCEHLKSTENPEGECRPQAHLMVMLPKVNLWGYYQITTGSTNSRVSILRDLQQMQQMLGSIANIPILLTRIPQEVTYQGKKKTHYIVTFQPAMGIDEVRDYLAKPTHHLIPQENVLIEQMADENPLLDPVDEIIDDEIPLTPTGEQARRDEQAELNAVREALKAKEAERAASKPIVMDDKIPVAEWRAFLDRIDNDEALVAIKVDVKLEMGVKDLRFIGARQHEFIKKMQERCAAEGRTLPL
jgi:hypothetical protein